jgi:hypothetical protein
MNLFELTLQIVPLIFISLFLDLPRAGAVYQETVRPKTRVETAFDLIVASLGLLAFMVSLYAIGSEAAATPEPWMRFIVITALSFAMAALFSQVLLRIIRNDDSFLTHRRKDTGVRDSRFCSFHCHTCGEYLDESQRTNEEMNA